MKKPLIARKYEINKHATNLHVAYLSYSLNKYRNYKVFPELIQETQ
jgi:hypothetical protein